MLKLFSRKFTQVKNTTKSPVLDTTISHHEWHEYFNSLANSPLPIQPSCKGPNTATHDQEVDEIQATEDTQLETSYRLCNHRRGSCVRNQENKKRIAPGPDDLSVEALKCFNDRTCDTLSVIFNKVYESNTNTFPQEWGCGTKMRLETTLGITIHLVEMIISELYSSLND